MQADLVNQYRGRSVILYDGFCPLCNLAVRVVLLADKKTQYLFAPLREGLLSQLLSHQNLIYSDSVILLEIDMAGQTAVFTKSDAIVRIGQNLNFPWSMLRLIRVIPHSFRDRLYDLVAKNRSRLFGRYDSCPLPPEKYRKNFIHV